MKNDVSKTLIVTTLIVLAIMLYTVYYFINSDRYDILCAVLAVFALLLLPIAWIPLKTIETDSMIVVKKIIGSKVFMKSDYDVQPMDLGCAGTAFRLFAGCVWVYWGIFWSKRIGRYYGLHVSTKNLLLLTNRNNGNKVLIDAPG